MKTYYSYGNNGRRIAVIIMAVLYFVIAIGVTRLGRLETAPMFMGASVLGVLTAVQFLIALSMVAVEFELGGILAISVTSFSAITAIIPLVLRQNMASLPGILNDVACIIAIVIIRNQFAVERKKSFVDDLTGISNRKHMIHYMNHLLSHKIPFYVILLDLDHFKKLNDMVGHSHGDQLLKDLSIKWAELYKSNAVIGRLGGDEFLVVVKKRNCNDIEFFAQKYIEIIRDIADAPYSLCPSLTVSTGIVEAPLYGEDVDDLLRKADISVRRAQQGGRNLYMKYQESFEAEVVREQFVESRIKYALDNDLFYMVYQPQFEANTKKLRGFESLIRMKPINNEDPIYPGEFIPIAEKTNLIVDIGGFVLRAVAKDFADVVKANDDIVVSVNISAKQLLAPGFADLLKVIFQDTGFNPKNLEIEITEYCLMDTADEAIKVVQDIKALGVSIAMDDFGTGYSSLSYLSKLSIDLLKIDKTLVDDMGEGEIIEAICSVSHALECEVVAEGVEEESQLGILKGKGCNYIQGYIWSKPLAYEDAMKLID